MPFSEKLKNTVKRKSHFCCCLCHALSVEVHHIVPQADGGSDDEDNAAPLCPSCHEIYGANAQKRKFIREARDFWYELCAKRYATDPARLDELSSLLATAATKDDLAKATDRMIDLIRETADNPDRAVQEKAQQVAQVGSLIAPGVGVNRRCMACGTSIGLYIGDQGKCPQCGTPW